MFADRRVLVTGGTGLVGHHVVDELLQRGASTRVVTHRRPNPFGADVDVVEGDLRSAETCSRAVAGAEFVVHAAGVGGGSGKVAVAPVGMFTDSLLMNTHMLEAARLAGVERYLFISNSSVYAPSDKPLTEDDAWGETTRGIPENETGTVKRTGETQCQLYARFSDMAIGIIRGGNAYGSHDNFDLETSHVVPALIRKAVERQDPFVVWGSGEPVRDFTHARDIARGGLHVLERHAIAEPVNIASGVSVPIRELVSMILELSGHTDASVIFTSDAPHVSAAKRLDVARMRALGFDASTSLRDGLNETISWYERMRAPAAG